MNCFKYSAESHNRRHGPYGYSQYPAFKPWLRDEFQFRCVYCLMRETWYYDGSDHFGVDHIIPKSIDPSKENDYVNLVYACSRCNSAKGSKELIDPCRESVGDYIAVTNDGSFIPISSPKGQILIEKLNLNDPRAIEYRFRLMTMFSEWESSGKNEYLDFWLGYPLNLPNLSSKKCQNSKPEAAKNCYYSQKERGLLPKRY